MRTFPRDPLDRLRLTRWRPLLLPIAGIAVIFALLALSHPGASTRMLSYTRFLTDVDDGGVRALSIDQTGHVTGDLATGHRFATDIPLALDDQTLAARLAAHRVQVSAATAAPSSSLLSILLGLLPLLLILGIVLMAFRSARRRATDLGNLSGTSGVTTAKARVIDSERPNTGFADVAGYGAVKTEVSEIVDFLRAPQRYQAAGARGPRGVLMAGPPGTGKTLLARAVAGEAHVPFFSVSGSSFVEMFVGVGAARVRDLFEQARTRAPAIVFIDEIDALGTRRGGDTIPSNTEYDQTLNQLLAEMDGFEGANGVVVLAATNRPDALDPALRRPGRLDREVLVPLPNRAERRAILDCHARDKHLDEGVDLDAVAATTPGFSGADLANLVNEAAVSAVRAGRTTLSASDFTTARDRVVLGTRDRAVSLTADELATVAVHEAGHALVASLSASADPVSRVTILGAGHALGLTELLPADERHLYSESYLVDTLAVKMGGRAAERLIRGEASSGAADDLASATALAIQMVRDLGLSEAIGPVSYGVSPDQPAVITGHRRHSEQTQWRLDQEVTILLTGAEARAQELLTRHLPALRQLSEMLLEQETVSGDQVRALVGAGVDGDEPARTESLSAEPSYVSVD